MNALTEVERKKFYFFSLANIAMSLLDIILLAALVLIVSVYSGVAVLPDVEWLHDSKIIYYVLAIALLYITKNGFAAYLSNKQFHFSYKVAARVSSDKMQEYLDGRFEDHVENDSSIHIKSISHQPVQFSQYILMGWMNIFTEAALLLFTIIAIIIFNLTVFSLLLITLLPAFWLVKKATERKLHHTRDNINTASEKNIQYLNEALRSYVEANIFGKKSYFKTRYSKAQQQMNHHLASLQASQARNGRFIEMFAITALLVLIAAHELLPPSSAIIVNISVFLAASYKVIPGVVKIINTNSQIRTFQACIPIFKSSTPNEAVASPAINGIQLKNVSFSFKDKAVIEDLSFAIHSGEIVGLKGRSGKGKTTLINLLSGFLNETSGKFYFNNKEVNAASRRDFWNRVSYAKQDAFLVHDTVAANVSFETNPDDQKLDNSLKSAGVIKFLTGVNEGIHYFITENGKNISGGQRQRLTIARALYKNADLYILDEPFNELDKQSEKEIMLELKKLADAGKMILLITHDDDTLAHCDKIISLDE